MPIGQTDIEMRLSGGSANFEPHKSLGGTKSQMEIVDSIVNNLWSNVTPTQSRDGRTSYRCVYIHNEHPTITYSSAKIWVHEITASDDDAIDIGIGTSAIGATEQTIADETTAPASVSFSKPLSLGTALSLGSIPARSHKAVWIKRTVDAGASVYMSNYYTLKVNGFTLA